MCRGNNGSTFAILEEVEAIDRPNGSIDEREELTPIDLQLTAEMRELMDLATEAGQADREKVVASADELGSDEAMKAKCCTRPSESRRAIRIEPIGLRSDCLHGNWRVSRRTGLKTTFVLSNGMLGTRWRPR